MDQTNVVHTFIVACNGTVCDTTFITINPPSVSCSLPVTLVSFDATNTDDSRVLLEWVTSGEENSKEFAIQKSEDAKNWRMIKTVSAANISSELLNYKSYDTDPSSGVNYYRLKMIDMDDSYTFSRIRSVEFSDERATSIYPNPASTTLNIKMSNWKEVVKVELLNASGVKVYSSVGTSGTEVNVKNYPAGTYLIKVIRVDGSVSVQKVSIVK